MKYVKSLTVYFLSLWLVAACSSSNESPQVPDPDPDPSLALVKGADISWVTEMEKMGKKFYNASGAETDCFQLMKEIGMDAIRLRVWVDPVGGWCNREETVAKALRVKAQGLKLMVDFHYSDLWADPGRQTKPEAWKDYTVDQLKKAVADHTKDVLNALKLKGVTPEWVQVGNETRNGMLWEERKLWSESGSLNHWGQYAALSNSGYNAVKSVFPNATVIVHIDNGWEDNDWWFKDFKAAGGKWDMIGLSHYPQYPPIPQLPGEKTKGWKEMNDLCMQGIRKLAESYKCQVMMCEIGMKADNESLAKQVMTDFMKSAQQIEALAGVFYWEPEVYGDWKPEIYNEWKWGAYDMGAFTSTGKPAAVLDAFVNTK